MSKSHPDDKLESVLRASEPEIADAQFSERVLAQLPPKRRWGQATTRRWTLTGAAGLGSLVTYLAAEPIEQALSAYVALPPPVVTVAVLALIVSLPIAWILHSE
jgi:hypothetical protein